MATSKQELSWVNVQATALTGDMLKAWNELNKARDAFKAAVTANARKAKAISPDETLIINTKPWGFGMAKAPTKSAQAVAKAGDMFGSL